MPKRWSNFWVLLQTLSQVPWSVPYSSSKPFLKLLKPRKSFLSVFLLTSFFVAPGRYHCLGQRCEKHPSHPTALVLCDNHPTSIVYFQMLLAKRGGQKPEWQQSPLWKAIVPAQLWRIAGGRSQDAEAQGAGRTGWIRGRGYVQPWDERQRLGCVNLPPTASRSKKAGFTQLNVCL